MWTSLNQYSQPVWTSLIQLIKGFTLTTLLMHKNWLEQCEPVLTMSPWTAHAQPVRTGLSSVNQFKPVFPTSLNQFDDNLHYAAHAQKLVRTGFSSLNQFSHPVWTGLNQFGPVWTSFNCFLWQSTLHCSCTTNKNWFEQCELVWTSTHSQFEPVWSS